MTDQGSASRTLNARTQPGGSRASWPSSHPEGRWRDGLSLRGRGGLTRSLVVLLLLKPGSVCPTAAQSASPERGQLAGDQLQADSLPRLRLGPWRPPSPQVSRTWWNLWTVPSTHDRILLGMWTFHPFSAEERGLENNEGIGVQYRSLFAFTCVNSFERRTWAAGVERVWLEARRGEVAAILGLRAGLIHGYDTELIRVAGETPFLPFAGALLLFRLGPVGGEVSWVYRAFSVVGAIFL